MHEEPLTLAAPPQTRLERTDTRVKIVCLLIWAVCVVTVPPRRPILCSVYAIVLALLLLGNLRLIGKFARRLAAALPLVLLLAVFLPFIKQGQRLWNLGPIEITREGVWTAQRVATAAILCVGAMALVWASTSESRLLAGLRGFKLPELLVNVLAFMLRYLHVLRRELHRLTDARAARTIGAHGPGGIRSGANVVGALFVRAHDRAERVADAMVMRGFSGRRRELHGSHWHAEDLAAGGFFAILVIGLRLAVQA